MTEVTPAAALPAAIDTVPVTPAETVLPPLRRVLAIKPIARELGVEIAPGQIAWLPALVAEAEIDAGNASDPDAKEPPAKTKPKT
jgi:hypothetical protein